MATFYWSHWSFRCYLLKSFACRSLRFYDGRDVFRLELAKASLIFGVDVGQTLRRLNAKRVQVVAEKKRYRVR